MKMKFHLLFLALSACALTVQAQRAGRNSRSVVTSYMDSLQLSRARIDTMHVESSDSRYTMLFPPFTFYHSAANHLLRLNPGNGEGDSLDLNIDKTLMYTYLHRPDLVRSTESKLDKAGVPLTPRKQQKPSTDIVEVMAPEILDAEVEDPMEIYIAKPNFWTYAGDYYLQFLQNYVSENWYKGGESNYSMLGSITMQANYNNKQKLKWDNKLELKLGYQTSKGDSVHRYKTSEDLIRYTSKLGLQATKQWYYTLQLIAQTQFTKTVQSNDATIYSDFFSPFTLNLSVGMDYTVDWLDHKLKGSAHFAPLAANWKYVGRANLATRYGVDEGKHSKMDYGSECTFDLTWQLADNIKWKTRLYGYTTYHRAELEWENTVTFQFNKYISTNVFLYPRFDDGATRVDGQSYWQFKEYMSIGFSYSF